MSSVPTIEQFKPLPHQLEVIKSIRRKYDYELGVHEVLLSGAVGSAKTAVGAHLAVTHALMFPNAHVGVGRFSKQTLKDTLWQAILDHSRGGIDYRYNGSALQMRFNNGSMISGHFWGDKNYLKFRSQAFSMFITEELTENDTPEAYDEIMMRLGRMANVPEKVKVSLTNPDDPSHWAYKQIIKSKSPTTHVFYSKTEDNPYLPASYIKQLREKLDPRMARRMLHGEWLSIAKEVIYYSYSDEENFKDIPYKVNEQYPIHICWDFNIGHGKPLSVCLFQYIGGVFHVFAEVIIHGMRTRESCEEMADRGLLNYKTKYILQGDATGRHKDTRNKHSDWEIIEDFFAAYTYQNKHKDQVRIIYEVSVPLDNPGVRDRHNKVNAQLCNDFNIRRLFVYQDCPTVDEGLRLTKLKPGAQYLEDDSKHYQHVTTALGYGICDTLEERRSMPIRQYQR